MAGFMYKGILLQQNKEPALSRDLREFFDADTIGISMDRAPVERSDELTAAELCQIARDAHIIDERDGQLLAEKLEAVQGHPPRLLVGDAIDDEPYLSSQLGPLLKLPRLAGEGLRFAQKACGASEATFAVYKNLSDLDIRIPKAIEGFSISRIHGRYPAEYQASKLYSADEGALMIGVCALIHLARAIRFNKPQTTAFITVAGNCIGTPTNLEISLGMTISQVLERCGLIEDPARVVVGGSMTGYSVLDTENTLIIPTTRAVLAFKEDFQSFGFHCIGCSRCVHACPEGLNPFYLYHSALQKRYGVFRAMDAQMCIGCGTCSYMCPSKLDLSGTIRRAAAQFKPMAGSIRAFSVLQKKKEQADLECYLKEDVYRREQKLHKRALRTSERALAAVLRGLEKQEKAARNALEKGKKAALPAEELAALQAAYDCAVAAAPEETARATADCAQAKAAADAALQAAQEAAETARAAALAAGGAAYAGQPTAKAGAAPDQAEKVLAAYLEEHAPASLFESDPVEIALATLEALVPESAPLEESEAAAAPPAPRLSWHKNNEASEGGSEH